MSSLLDAAKRTARVIAAVAIVMAAVGRRSIVAAGAIVTRPVPARVLTGGVPARVLAHRNPALVQPA